ncbi:MAG: cytochrome c biogenesis protein CcsA [Thermodesulfobacteriota bacterium]
MILTLSADFILHWTALLCYVPAMVANGWGVVFDRPRGVATGRFFLLAGLLAHGLALLSRWLTTGHGPYISRYEVLSSNAWVALVLYLLAGRIYPRVRPASIVVFPAAFFLIALGMVTDREMHNLPPTFHSGWLVLHVLFYKVALATLLVGFAFSLFLILRRHAGRPWLDRLPDSPACDVHAYRFAGFGFIFWAVAMLTGSIWAYQSWGRFWAWDPIETWSLATWGLLGLYLHLRRFFGWQGKRAAWLYLGCFAVSLIVVFFLPLFDSSVHSSYFQ